MQQLATDLTLDSISKEQVLDLLKEKVYTKNMINQVINQGREVQKIQKKLDAVQEKYIQQIKDQKLIIKDKEILERLLGYFLNEEPYLFQSKKSYGQYEYSELLELCQKRDDTKQSTLNNLIQATQKEKYELEEKMKLNQEKQISQSDNKTKQIIQQLKQQNNDLEQNNMRLAKEIIELNDIIQIKNNEIDYLKNIEDDFTNYKTQIMMQEIEQQSQFIQNQSDTKRRYQKSETINEKLILQNRIEDLLDKNKQLQQTIDQLNKQSEKDKLNIISPNTINVNKNNSQQDQFSLFSLVNDYEINPFDGDQNQSLISSLHLNFNPNHGINGKLTSTASQTIEQNQNLNKNNSNYNQIVNDEYLKNVIFKYFLYSETKNYKEAQILRNAIMTILKMSKEERTMIDELRNKATVWKQAKTYISESVFCYRPGQILTDNQIQGSAPVQQNPLLQTMNKNQNMK